MKHIPIFIIFLSFISCRPRENRDFVSQPESWENGDTLFINSTSAVFYEPDTARIERRKREVGEEDFYIGADDYSYYMYLANIFLDSMKLPIYHNKNKKYLKFISSNSQKTVKLDTLSELWGVYFFDPKKELRTVDIIDIDSEYHRYFSIPRN